VVRLIHRTIQDTVKKTFNLLPKRYSHEFKSYYKWLMETQWLSVKELEEIQNEQLIKLIEHAYQNVPYYTKLFQKLGITPDDIQKRECLKLLPILTKDDIRLNFNDLIAKNHKDFKPILKHTSGSTGEPLKYYIDKNLDALTKAAVRRHWAWCGIGLHDTVAVFRGSLIEDFKEEKKMLVKQIGNDYHFSTFEMTPNVMNDYVGVINKKQPEIIRGYPSSLEILANHINQHGLKVHSPKVIHTSSEVVLSHQRKQIEKAFMAPLFDWYGHGESTVCAGECEKHNGLHLNLEFGLTEFIKSKETEQMVNVFNIISTSLWNFSMPLIRYDTEDLCETSNEKCECGRDLPLIKKLYGRQSDIITGINGIRVSPSSFVHYWKNVVAARISDIKYAQIVQEESHLIRIKLVGKQKESNEKIIKDEITNLLGNSDIEFQYLKDIPTGQKWRFTVSNVRGEA